MKTNLQQLYNNELQPQLIELEKLRKSILRKLEWALGAIIVFFIIIPLLTTDYKMRTSSITVGLASILFFIGTAYFKHSIYREQFKKNIVKKIVRLINPTYQYNEENKITFSTFNNSKLFLPNTANHCLGSDYVKGKIEKVNFEFSNIKAVKYNGTTESYDYETIFEGLFFCTDFNKYIQSTTIVLPDFHEKYLGKTGQNIQDFFNHDSLVKLENPEFEKNFVVYSTSQQEARYILTPSIMEAIVNIKTKFKHRMYFSFTEECVYCAIPYKHRLFEPQIFKSCINLHDLKRMYQLLELIETIIQEMNLNTHIWTKK